MSRAARAIRNFHQFPTVSSLLMTINEVSQNADLMRQLEFPIGQYMEYFMHNCIRLPAAYLLPRKLQVKAGLFLMRFVKYCGRKWRMRKMREARLRGSLYPSILDSPSPFDYVMQPKPFKIMSEEKRFSRKNMKLKPNYSFKQGPEYPRNSLMKNIPLIDPANPSNIDYKANYKLFTYFMDTDSNTLIRDVPFRRKAIANKTNELELIANIESSAKALRRRSPMAANLENRASTVNVEHPENNMMVSDVSSESEPLDDVEMARGRKTEISSNCLGISVNLPMAKPVSLDGSNAFMEFEQSKNLDCNKSVSMSDSSSTFDFTKSDSSKASQWTSDSSPSPSPDEALRKGKGKPKGNIAAIEAGNKKLFSYNLSEANIQQLLPTGSHFHAGVEANVQAMQIHGHVKKKNTESYLNSRMSTVKKRLEAPCGSELAMRLKVELAQIRRKLVKFQGDSKELADMDVQPNLPPSTGSSSSLSDSLENMTLNASVKQQLQTSTVPDKVERKVNKRHLSSNDSPFDYKPIERGSSPSPIPEKRRSEEPQTRTRPHSPHGAKILSELDRNNLINSMNKIKSDLRVAQHQLRTRMIAIHGRLEQPCTSKEANKLNDELSTINDKLERIDTALGTTVGDESSDMDLDISPTDDEEEPFGQQPPPCALQNISFNESGFLESTRLEQTLSMSANGIDATDKLTKSQLLLQDDSGIAVIGVKIDCIQKPPKFSFGQRQEKEINEKEKTPGEADGGQKKVDDKGDDTEDEDPMPPPKKPCPSYELKFN